MLKVISVTSQPERAERLVKSLKKNGWDYELIVCQWKGFGTKLIETYNYLKEHPEVAEFVFCDAHDVVVLGTPEEFKEKMNKYYSLKCFVISAERGLWPPMLTPFKEFYCQDNRFDRFVYPNSGLYYCPSNVFIELFEKYPPFHQIDDQYWINTIYLLNNLVDVEGVIYPELDFIQCIFNSHSFISEGEYTYANGRSTHNTLGTSAVFLHGNGGGLPKEVYDLII